MLNVFTTLFSGIVNFFNANHLVLLLVLAIYFAFFALAFWGATHIGKEAH